MRSLRASSSGQIDGEENEFEGSKGKKGLYSVFTSRIGSRDKALVQTREKEMVYKEISPDMKLFVSHLYKEGYLNDANFLSMENSDNDGLDFSRFENSFGFGFIKFAAQNYGKDNQEIAK